jgi:hypothetical protein
MLSKPTQEDLIIARYKLFTVISDETFVKLFPELADDALKALLKMEKEINKLKKAEMISNPHDKDTHKPAGARVQRNLLSF